MTRLLSAAQNALLQRLRQGGGTATAEITVRPAGSVAPISAEQEHIWLHAAMALDVPLYNEPVTIHRRGDLDLDRLQASLDEILGRHEIWRTGFEMQTDGVIQRVHDDVAVPIRLTDLSSLPPPERETAALRIATREACELFDLARPPLLRAHLVRFGAEEHRLYLTLHHIIFDGVTIYRLFMPLLAATYAAGSLRHRVAGPPAIQYADYAVWRRRQVESAELERQLGHWRDVLAGELPVLRLPTDHPPPPVPGFDGGMDVFALPAGLTDRLRQVARRLGVTDYVMFLTVFQVLLFRCSGQGDIIVGGVTDTRRRLELEPMVGYFLNSFPIRTRPDFATTFADYARQTACVVIAGLDAADVPLSRILRELQPRRGAGAHPLFQAMFSMEPPAPAFADGWDLTQLDVTTGTAKFDLYLELDERPDGLIGRMVFRRDLFEAATVRRMLGHWFQLLDSVAADPECRLGQLDMLTRTEQHQQARWNDTAADIPEGRLDTLIEAQARRTPDAVAVIGTDATLTYRELLQKAAQVAGHLGASGIGPRSLVGVCVERGAALICGLLGILKIGAAYLPLDAALPPARRALYLREARPDAILVSSRLRHEWSEQATRLVVLEEAVCEASGPPSAVPSPADLAYVLFTSGTTGTPRAVEVTHRALVNLLASMQREPGFGPADSLLAVTAIAFDIAGLEMWLPLLSGGTVVTAGRDVAGDPARLAEFIARVRPSVMQATPTLWRALIEAGWPGQAGLKILCGGEALPRALADELLTRAESVWNLYGPTETTIWSTLYRVGPGSGPVPIGRPIANTKAFVLDAEGGHLPVGVIGELHLGGAGLARGYRRQDALTAERFAVRPGTGSQRVYRTGDLARLRADGAIEYLGRTDDQVKIRGHRISLAEIEACLATHPEVLAAVVHAADDGVLAACLVARDDAPSPAALRRFLRHHLPDVMIPDRYTVVAALPRTPNGKLDRAALRQTAMAPVDVAAEPPVVPAPTERALLAIFRRLLGVSRIDRNDSFFDLGGHSLLAARMLAEVRRRFGRAPALGAVFRTPTIAGLADYLREQGAAVDIATLSHRHLMSQFESLGEDCEFGLMQRRHGADPFGLLRFSGIAIDDLIVALDDQFGAMGDPAGMSIDMVNGRCVVRNHSYRCAYELPTGDGVRLVAEAAKQRVLRPMLLRTLERGSRICVIKARDGLRDDQIDRLQIALRRHGPAPLLWVRAADSEHQPGTVRRQANGLLIASIDRFAPEDAPDESSPIWLTLCEAAYRLWRTAESAAA